MKMREIYMLINDKWIDKEEKIEVLNPYTGRVAGKVPKAEVKDVREVIEKAKKAKIELTAYERYQLLYDCAQEIKSREAEFLLVRENISKQELIRCGIPEERITVVPDAAFGLTPNLTERVKVLLETNGLIPNSFVVFTPRQWVFKTEFNRQKYMEGVAETADFVIESLSLKVALVSHTQGPIKIEDDRVIAEDIYKLIKNKENAVIINEDLSPPELISLYSRSKFVIGTRFHSIIFALIGKRPCIAISYSGPKAHGIMQMFGLEEFVINIDEFKTEDCVKLIKIILDRYREIQEGIILRLETIRREVLDIQKYMIVDSEWCRNCEHSMTSTDLIHGLYNKIEPKFPPVRIFKRIYRTIRPLRYNYLFEIIRNNKCKRIMEIGTWNGDHALQMIEEAKKNFAPEEIEYYGFDLFELMNSNIYIEEVSKKPSDLETVRDKLKKTNAKISLYKGDTKEILPNVINDLPKMDFIFIDGGHSIETIENDWRYTQQVMDDHTIVIFDDYWNREDAGCKKVVDAIDKTKYEVTILPIQDKFKKEWGTLTINFVQVKLRTKKRRTK